MRHVRIEKLWEEAKKFKKQSINVSELSHVLSENVWGEEIFSLNRFIHHMKKCLEADDSYLPILVKENDEYFVLDGNHRISVMIAKGHSKIDAIVLPESYNNWIVIT